MFYHAAGDGNLVCMKWLHDNGCPWDESVFSASTGNLEIMKWLKNNKCSWDEDTFTKQQEGTIWRI